MQLAGRPLAFMAVSLLLVGCGPALPVIRPPWAQSPGPPPELKSFYQQKLNWQPCLLGECTTLQVPLDYGRPSFATLGIGVFRAPASDHAHRIGSLVVNPGGPGAPGIDFAREASQAFPTPLRDRFDIVGFDPRGVGQSAPIRCLSDAQLDTYTQEPAYPTNAQEQASFVGIARTQAQACQHRNPQELAHVSTADAARDMDVLRAALGDSQLTYYGASYGTFLGTLYAEQFPTHVRALVLDSPVDPARSGETSDLQQAQAFEQVLKLFLSTCVQNGNCPLGDTVPAAQARLDQFLGQVAQHPLPGAGSRTAGSGPVQTALAAAMYNPAESFPQLEKALEAGLTGDGSPLLAMADGLSGRDSDGHYSNLIDSNTAINCIDRPHPTSVQTYARDAAQAAALAPHFGASNVWSGVACAFWPAPPQTSTHRANDSGAPPVLVVATKNDPATPYQWGVDLSHELNGAVLLTFDYAIHGAFARGAACIDKPVATYLTTLELPPSGSICEV
jgi:pimeloyl-ACP methyl ester carboxylesterase